MVSARAAPFTKLLPPVRHRAPTVPPAISPPETSAPCALLAQPRFPARPLVLDAAPSHTATHQLLVSAQLAPLAKFPTTSNLVASPAASATSRRMRFVKCAYLELKQCLQVRPLALLALIASTPPPPQLVSALNAQLDQSPTQIRLVASLAKLDHIS
jgi:hypothetical protein